MKNTDVSILFYRLRSYLKYLLKARYYKGHGIHSPFAYFLVRELFYEEHTYHAFKQIDAARHSLMRNNLRVGSGIYGSGTTGKRNKKIKTLAVKSSLPSRYGKILFRLINHFSAKNILELGTGLGISTLYFSMVDSQAKITTIEADPTMREIASRVFELTQVENVKMEEGLFRHKLPSVLQEYSRLDFVFFDGDHRFGPTLQYFEMCLKKAHNESVFVFDDIHWSPEMEAAWKKITEHPMVTVSMDLYRLGIVFFKKECTKQHYVVFF